jgi:hypothetical protein
MDLTKVLQQLHEELDNLNAAIDSLERLQEAGKHRSEAPAWIEGLKASPRREKRKIDKATP